MNLSLKVQNITKRPSVIQQLPPEFYSVLEFFIDQSTNLTSENAFYLTFIAKKVLTAYSDQAKNYSASLKEGKEDELRDKSENLMLLNSASKEILLKIFQDSLSSQFASCPSYLSTLRKKSILFVRSQTLKIWRERVLDLNYSAQTLTIMKIGQKTKGDKELALSTYSLKWIGREKNRFLLRIDSISSKNKYKSFLIAAEILETAIEWHQNIRFALYNCTLEQFFDISKKSQLIFTSNSSESVDQEGGDGKERGWKSFFGKKKGGSDIRPDRESAIGINAINKSSIAKIHEGEKNEKIAEKNDKAMILVKEEKNESIEKKEKREKEEEQLEKTFETVEKKAETNEQTEKIEKITHIGNLEEEMKKFADPKQSIPINEKTEINNLNVSEIIDHEMENMVDPTEQDDDSKFEDFNEVLVSRRMSCPNIMQDVLINLDLEEITSEQNYNLIHEEKNFRMVQNTIESTKYKLFIKLNNPLTDVVNSILDINNLKLFNDQISDMKILKMIQHKKSAIIYEKRKAYGRLYLPREFVYMRYSYELKDGFLIAHKSIEYDDLPHSYFSPTIRGTIFSWITLMKPDQDNPKASTLIININLSNNGAVSYQQDHEITLNYLLNYSKIHSFISSAHLDCIIKELHNNQSEIASPSHLNENNIRRQTKVLTAMDLINKEMIMEGLLINEKKEEEKTEAKGTRRFSSYELNHTSETKSLEEITDKRENVENSQEEGLILRELSIAFNLSADFLLKLIETNGHIIKCLKIKHNQKVMEIKKPVFQQLDEVDGHYVLKNRDWIPNKSGGFIYHNKKVLDTQKKILSYLLKKMGTNLIQGKSIMSISLPVELFETRSHLERLAYNFTFAPHFLNKANDIDDPVEQMKLTVTFFVTSLHMATAQLKPFNPILGETFQGKINGLPIYLEQISHHPPISTFLLYGKEYKMVGQYEAHASLHANSCTASLLGAPYLKYKNGCKITVSVPTAVISGTSFGQRTFNYEGKLYAFDERNLLACEITFNPEKKGMVSGLFSKQTTPSDYFSGFIFKTNVKAIEKIRKVKVMNKFDGFGKEDIGQEISKISGIWHKNIEFDGVQYWEMGKIHAYQLDYDRTPLPSDSIYREDLIVWKTENIEKAQLIKEKMENNQREDRKLRAKFEKKSKGKKNH